MKPRRSNDGDCVAQDDKEHGLVLENTDRGVLAGNGSSLTHMAFYQWHRKWRRHIISRRGGCVRLDLCGHQKTAPISIQGRLQLNTYSRTPTRLVGIHYSKTPTFG